MGEFKFVKARNYKDYWIINELAEQCNEEGKDGRFRWCYAPMEHVTLPYIEEGHEAKLVITKGKVPKIVGFYAYDAYARRLDVIYVVPKMRGKHIALDMVDNFIRLFPGEKEYLVLNPCRAVRKLLNKHYPGRFKAVTAEGAETYVLHHYEDEDLVFPGGAQTARP